MKNIRFPKLGFNLTTLLYALALVAFALSPDRAIFALVPLGAGMIIDAQLLFSDSQALTATAVSTNVIDLSSDRNVGIGKPLAIVIVVDVALDRTTGDETYAVTLQTDDNAAFSSAATVTGPVSLLQYTVGSRFVIAIPPNIDTERYLRLNYTLGGTTPTGTLTAFIQPLDMIGVGENVYYADAITIG